MYVVYFFFHCCVCCCRSMFCVCVWFGVVFLLSFNYKISMCALFGIFYLLYLLFGWCFLHQEVNVFAQNSCYSILFFLESRLLNSTSSLFDSVCFVVCFVNGCLCVNRLCKIHHANYMNMLNYCTLSRELFFYVYKPIASNQLPLSLYQVAE